VRETADRRKESNPKLDIRSSKQVRNSNFGIVSDFEFLHFGFVAPFVDYPRGRHHISPMTSPERLAQEIKAAILAKDAERLSALRMLKSAVGYVQLEKKTDNLSEPDFIGVVQKEVKKRRDSIEQFEKGGRPELADKEKKEITVLETFLPKPLSPEELEQLVKATIQELGATSKKEMGPVIKAVQAKAAGRAEGKTISTVVGKLLP
jgi:uncharacterized protein